MLILLPQTLDFKKHCYKSLDQVFVLFYNFPGVYAWKEVAGS